METKLRSWGQKIKRSLPIIAIIAFSVLLVVLIVVEVRLYGTGFAGKTLFDWLNLLGVLAIPVVAGFGVAWFSQLQEQRDKKLADERADSERKATEQRAELEREIALDNQQETALQAYMDRMSELLLEYDLLKAPPSSEIRTIARLRTTSAIRGLDPRRKGYVLRFVYGAGLIKIDDPIIELKSAKFSDVNLRVTSLIGVSIIGANFWKAIFSGAELNGDFQGTTFDEADLREASLGGDFRETSFNKADLRNAGLGGDFSGASLVRANLEGAHLNGAVFRNANLRHADLRRAHLGQTQLCYADLSYANLEEVDFRSVNLEGAILKGATNITSQQLSEAYLLRGATMPDGSIYP
jgi:hypothetical protein